MTQSVAAVRAALLAGCQSIFAASVDTTGAPVLVCLGAPGTYQPDFLVVVAPVTRQPVARLTMGVVQRTAEVDTIFSLYVQGDENAATTAANSCDALVDIFETWVQSNSGFGGACMDSTITNIAGPDLVAIEHPESAAVTGYLATTVVTTVALVLN